MDKEDAEMLCLRIRELEDKFTHLAKMQMDFLLKSSKLITDHAAGLDNLNHRLERVEKWFFNRVDSSKKVLYSNLTCYEDDGKTVFETVSRSVESEEKYGIIEAIRSEVKSESELKE